MTEKIQLTDAELQSNMLPWFFLDDGTRARFKAWPHGVVFLLDGRWLDSPKQMWRADLVYRAKPAPKTKPVYPWSALPDWVKACAVDADGMVFSFSQTPLPVNQAWVLGGTGTRARIDHIHKGYIPGTCDWRDTLEHRPEDWPK